MKQKLLATLIICSISIGVFAQCELCTQALQKDLIYLDYSSFSNEHLLQIVESSNFWEKKQEAQSQKHYEATYKVYSGILKESKDYSDFEQKRNTYFNSINFSSTKQTSLQYFENKMSQSGYNSYDNCINRCMGKPGLYLLLKNKTECQVSISLEYIASSTDPNSKFVIDSGSVSILNGSPLSNSAKKLIREKTTLSNFSKIEFTVQKTNNKEDLRIELNGKINELDIPASLNIPPMFQYETKETEKTVDITLQTDSNCTIEKCSGLKNIIKVEIISFEASGRTSDHPDGGKCNEDGYIADKTHPNFNTLQFGTWNNLNCQSAIDNSQFEGKGWHCNVGSCCRGGNRVGKVNNVKVRVTYKEFEFIKVPTPCN